MLDGRWELRVGEFLSHVLTCRKRIRDVIPQRHLVSIKAVLIVFWNKDEGQSRDGICTLGLGSVLNRMH